MAEKTRSNLRAGLQGILQAMYPTLTDLYRVSDKIYPPKNAAEKKKNRERSRHAKDYGKSPIVMAELILGGIDVNPTDLPKYIPKIRKLLKNKEQLSLLDSLLDDVIRRYGTNEVIAWLRLLIAKDEIREEMGLTKRRGRQKNK